MKIRKWVPAPPRVQFSAAKSWNTSNTWVMYMYHLKSGINLWLHQLVFLDNNQNPASVLSAALQSHGGKRSRVILNPSWPLRTGYPDERPSLRLAFFFLAAGIEMTLISAQKRDSTAVLIYDPDMRRAAAVSLKADSLFSDVGFYENVAFVLFESISRRFSALSSDLVLNLFALVS